MNKVCIDFEICRDFENFHNFCPVAINIKSIITNGEKKLYAKKQDLWLRLAIQ